MRLYGRIETSFWQNPKVRVLSKDARTLLLYILTCPHGNLIGCFVLPTGYICADLKLDEKQVSILVSELVSIPLIERDPTTDLTRIIGWWGHNTIDNHKAAKGALKILSTLPKCTVFVNAIQNLKQVNNRFVNELENEFQYLFAYTYPNTSQPPKPNLNLTEEDAALQAASEDSDEVSLFKRGKEILGKNSGGLIKNLLAAKKSVALARAAVEHASTKQDPREYIGAMIRNKDSPEDLRARGEAW